MSSMPDLKEVLARIETRTHQHVLASALHEINHEYAHMKKEGTQLFHHILHGRREMHDYVTTSLERGGYFYRRICEIFHVNTIRVKFYEDDKIRIESPQKIIMFENNTLHVYTKIAL